MSTSAILALDLGTGSVKALVVDRACRILGSAAAPYPVERPREDWAEQNPERWWNQTIAAARTALARAGSPEIGAIGISGQMHGTVLLDAEDQPVRPAIIWEDRRSAEVIKTLTERIGRDLLIERCGSPLATGFQAATLAWLVEHEPETIARTHMILLPGDYLRFRLTGAFITEPSDASSSLLFDITARDWAKPVLDAIGIEPAHVPTIMKSTDITGVLSVTAARELGLPSGIPVTGGGGDAPLAALAGGVTTSKSLMLTISTGSQAILPADHPITDPGGRIHTWCNLASPASGLPAWYQMGATMASGRALRWLREEIMDTTPDMLETEVGRVPPGADGLLFLPYLNGERTPHMDPDAAGAFIGLRARHGRAELSRAVMEGAVFALLDAFEILRELGGAPDHIVLAGGGARSQIWTQIVADIFALPVDPLEESEGSAMGAAIVAGTAIDWFALDQGARLTARFGDRIEPDKKAVSLYADLHPIFQRSYRSLASDFHALGQIAERARSVSINA